MRWVLGLAAVGLFLVACDEPVEACDDYVAYMCDCHAADVSCEEITATYADAAADVQDQCAIALEDQQAEDDQNGVVCP